VSGGLRLFSVRGVPITVHSTALLLAVLYSWSWSDLYRPLGTRSMVTAAVVGVLGVFVSILAHELGHVAAAAAFKVRTVDVALYGLGGMARLERPSPTPFAEIVISGAGPAVSVALGVGLLGVGVNPFLYPVDLATGLVWLLGQWNIFIGLFNLAPGPPFDGGGVLHGVLWAATGDRVRSMRIAAWCGLVAAAVCVGLAVADVAGFAVLWVFGAVLLVFGALPVLRRGSDGGTVDPAVAEAQAVFHRAAAFAVERGDDNVGTEHVLLGLAACGVDPLAGFLYERGITVERLRAGMAVPTRRTAGPDDPPFSVGAQEVFLSAREDLGGAVGLFLALPRNGPAAALLAGCGCDLATAQADLTRVATRA
jgi:Zn-dependent protease